MVMGINGIENFTGMTISKDQMYRNPKNLDLSPTYYEDWFSFANFLHLVTQTDFGWVVNIPENRVYVSIRR
jgi:DUF2075 family protein